MTFTGTIGMELEGALVNSAGNAVSFKGTFGDNVVKTGKRFERLIPDMDGRSIEFATRVCTSVEELGESLYDLAKLIPHGTRAEFKTRPFGGYAMVAIKERTEAMRQALLAESRRFNCALPSGQTGIDVIARHCSLQFQLGMTGMNNKVVQMRDFFEDIGPYAHLQSRKRYNIEDAEGHIAEWHGWCDARRTPAPRRFGTIQKLREFVGGIPKLIMLVDGKWLPGDGKAMSVLGEAESDGVLWHGARLRRYVDDDGKETFTIEWRTFPSMKFEPALEVADEVLRLAKNLSDYIDAHPEVMGPRRIVGLGKHCDPGRGMSLTTMDWTAVEKMYTELAKISWLVPKDRYFNDAGTWWWYLCKS